MSDVLYKNLKNARPFFLFAGPCVIENEAHCLNMAHRIKRVAGETGLVTCFKASYDKANRTSLSSYRGPGLSEGLRILSRVKEETGLPVLTDVHSPEECRRAAEVADILQIPAFLCRQTDLIIAAGKTGKVIHIKKGQFLAPEAMAHVVAKVLSTGNRNIILCDRGTTFGYGDLVVDTRGLVTMRFLSGLCKSTTLEEIGEIPVVQDVTHAVQKPGGGSGTTGGNRCFVPTIARAAVAVGVRGLFFEVHDDPDNALSDGPNNFPVDEFCSLLQELMDIAAVSKGFDQTYSTDIDFN